MPHEFAMPIFDFLILVFFIFLHSFLFSLSSTSSIFHLLSEDILTNPHHRRRRHNADNDIDYINERNMKFNQKCERFYGAYTQVKLEFF